MHEESGNQQKIRVIVNRFILFQVKEPQIYVHNCLPCFFTYWTKRNEPTCLCVCVLMGHTWRFWGLTLGSELRNNLWQDSGTLWGDWNWTRVWNMQDKHLTCITLGTPASDWRIKMKYERWFLDLHKKRLLWLQRIFFGCTDEKSTNK